VSNPASGAFTASSLPADAVELGRVQDAWGIKGWVRILPYSADTSALIASSQWFLEPPEARFARGFSAFSGCVSIGLAEVKPHTDGLVAQIEGVNDRNSAEALKGVRIYLPRSAFPAARKRGGKSGPRRAGCRLTAGRSKPRESAAQGDGKWNRKHTADGRKDQARLKWCACGRAETPGKSPPRARQRARHAKPHPGQGQIGKR